MIEFAEPTVKDEVAEADKVAKEVQTLVSNYVVASDEDLTRAAADLKRVRDYKKGVDETRKRLVKPLNDHVKSINAMFAPYIDKAEEAEGVLTAKMKEYNASVEKQRREEAERVRKLEQDRLAAELAEQTAKAATGDQTAAKKVEATERKIERVAQAPVEVRKTFGSSEAQATFKKVWKYEVIDERDVPVKWMSVDEKKVKAAIADGVREIPGLRIYEDAVVATR